MFVLIKGTGCVVRYMCTVGWTSIEHYMCKKNYFTNIDFHLQIVQSHETRQVQSAYSACEK